MQGAKKISSLSPDFGSRIQDLGLAPPRGTPRSSPFIGGQLSFQLKFNAPPPAPPLKGRGVALTSNLSLNEMRAVPPPTSGEGVRGWGVIAIPSADTIAWIESDAIKRCGAVELRLLATALLFPSQRHLNPCRYAGYIRRAG